MEAARATEDWVREQNIELLNKYKAYRRMVVPIAISTIVYQRVEVDENDFVSGCFGGVNYKVLKPISNKPYVNEVNKLIFGALEAIDRDYVCNMFFVIKSLNDPAKVVCYNFEFDYLGNGEMPVREMVLSPEETAIEMLRSLPSLNREYSMGAGVRFGILLRCYALGTPRDYVPTHYEEVEM